MNNTKEKDNMVKAQTKKEKCIHEGHRERLLDMAVNAGLENMSKFQVVEFFLTYIFPRGDVNPLAHRLLDRFESFTHIVEADIEDLKQVRGINDRSAKKINCFGRMFYYYVESRMSKKCVVKNLSEIIDIVEDHLRFRNTEHMLLLALSPANIITHKRRLSMNKEDEVGIPVAEFISFLNSSKAASLVVAHCHPYGIAKPSGNDEKAFEKVNELCVGFGVNLIESLIVGENGVFGQKEGKLLRQYVDVVDLKDAFGSLTD